MICEYCMEEFIANKSKTCCDECYELYERELNKSKREYAKKVYLYRRENNICVVCGVNKSNDGCRCFACATKGRERYKAYYSENIDKIKEYSIEYRKNKRKELNEYQREYRRKNKELISKKRKENYRKKKGEGSVK